ncbi:hypothetical protein [Azoarcus sp. DN11]|uniref:hypothetical protein n=1 Tax=Azoarcus sp. DN11 TaxID=356837 RepID=UPI000EB12F8E|nr:hypothetical protein [Azoarcus sp. DN11]AYH43343.1 hypothetical protein CDA09_08105 [Azoarcus sp. DN11]
MAKEIVKTEAYKAVRRFNDAVWQLEADRRYLVEILQQGSSPVLADQLFSAIGRLHYELGQIAYAEREHRRRHASGRA